MDPITHWVDIDYPSEAIYAAAITCAVVWIIVRVRRRFRRNSAK